MAGLCAVVTNSEKAGLIALLQVEDPGLRPRLGQHRVVLARGEEAAHLGLGVVEVAEVHAVGGADRDAGRVLALLHAVDAEGALVGVALGVHVAGVVGAGGEAGLAADALLLRDEDDPAPLVDVARPGGAAGHAGRVVAVVAPLRLDRHRELRVAALRGGGDPVAVHPLRGLVLRLAGDDAVHAADAAARVDDHAEARHVRPPCSRVTKLTFMPVPPMRGSVS